MDGGRGLSLDVPAGTAEGGLTMGDLIDLPSKRTVGKTFDLDGPGQVGTMYDCENRACNALRLAKIRALEAEGKEENHE